MAEIKKLYFCEKCHQTMSADNFYKSKNMEKYGDNDGYLHMCKKCLTMHVDNWNPDTYKPILQEIDVPYIPDEWYKILSKYRDKKITGMTIIGRYISKMHIQQYAKYRWKDTEFLQEKADALVRETMARQGYETAEIEKAIQEGKMPIPPRPETEDDFDSEITQQSYFNRNVAQEDFGLTEEDKRYLRLKWGSTYREEEWIKLERLYNEMMGSYDIQTAGHKNILELVCKSSLKANQLIDIGDIDGFQKTSKAYDGLMKSGNFTAVQNKTDKGEYVDSISELVQICETDGFIPRYYVDEPKDKIDRILQDLQGYTRSLILEETNLSDMFETAIKQIEEDNERAAKISTIDDDEDEAMLAELEAQLFAASTSEDKEDELTDDDFEDFYEWENS